MTERDEILAEMRRTADENGGKPLGRERFERATGIGESSWLRYWSRLGDLQRDAGYEPNRLRGGYDEAVLLEKLLVLIRELGRFPSSRELKTRAHSDGTFPSESVFRRRYGSKRMMLTRVAQYCADKSEYGDIAALLAPELAASETPDGADRSPEQAPRYGFVYLVKGHPGEYKIGRTNLVDRRLAELGATAAVEQKLVHEIKTDDPAGVETYWHRRFEARRMRGEWFSLAADDVKAFKRWRRIY